MARRDLEITEDSKFGGAVCDYEGSTLFYSPCRQECTMRERERERVRERERERESALRLIDERKENE